MNDTIENFIHTMHNGDNKKLRSFTFLSQRQGIQLAFMTDSLRTFMHTKNTKYNGDKAKLKILSSLSQRQRIQPNFMTDIIKPSYMPCKMLAKATYTTYFDGY